MKIYIYEERSKVMEETETRIQDNHLITAGGLQISFERTLKIPDDGKVYPLPPSLGAFPLYKISDFVETVPEEWRGKRGYFIPMYQSEAMWLNFSGSMNALIVNTGMINAITGKGISNTLDGEEQNYIVAPSQPWLDGFNAEDGYLRQFIVKPFGYNYTVKEQLSTTNQFDGVNFVIYSAKPGLISEDDEEINYSKFSDCLIMDNNVEGTRLKQNIYPDQYGIDTWDLDSRIEINIYFANSELFETITGKIPPSIPISEEEYHEHGYPWFDGYNE
jgi:hypothetical protein